MGKLTAEMPLMNSTALSDACEMSFSVAVGSASLGTTSATMTLTVQTAVMNILAVFISRAKAMSSLAPMASVLIKTGFVMEWLTV